MKQYLYLDLNGSWTLALLPNKTYQRLLKNDRCFSTGASLKGTEDLMGPYACQVPGTLEQDLYRAGVTGDPYVGLNTLEAQKWEGYHLFYFRSFSLESPEDITLRLEGLDTFADIYINGCLAGRTDNMLIEHELSVSGSMLYAGSNEIFIHITPATLAVADKILPASSSAHLYGYDTLYARKAPHMSGWDILPRMLGGGLWKDVYFVKKPADRFTEAYLYTADAMENEVSHLIFYYALKLDSDCVQDYTLKIAGTCGDSSFEGETLVRSVCGKMRLTVTNTKLWWPKNYGAANLYEVTATLYRDGEAVDTWNTTFGIRTIKLDRTAVTDINGSGEFCFIINGKKVFWLGSNWVPLDAMHSNDLSRLPKAMELLEEVGCNGLRCWGGNVYESDEFFDYCDRMGIMVWQDFSMACAYYPQEQSFYDMIRKEALAVVKRLRSHASLILWAGDNECDSCVYDGWNGPKGDPNQNVITRQIIPEILRVHDWTRPYLPSSPYIAPEAVALGSIMPSEAHLWGPRDYYKGNFYKNSTCHFASETGYHGCPSPSSLARFLTKEALWPWYDKDILAKENRYVDNPEWMVHSASPEVREDAPYAYRNRLMVRQITTLFGTVPEDITDFAYASQISQGEAFKYFIERFRLSKWRRTGIIWWNLLDGWPQISDAVVDYFFTKKLAFYYIKRSQQPLCFMFDEPRDGKIALFGVSDLQKDVSGHVTVKALGTVAADAASDDVLTLDSTPCLEADFTLSANTSVSLAELTFVPHQFYLIEWSWSDENGQHTGTNHYLAGDPTVSLAKYREALRLIGYDDFTV